MKRLFGTDGVRGIVGEELDANLAFSLGVRAAEVLATEKGTLSVLVGEDTRKSSPTLAAAISDGLAAGGARVYRLGVLPTPAVSYLTVARGANLGVVISASHNPHEYNGIKFLGADGEKLSDDCEEKIEEALLRPARGAERRGSVSCAVLGAEEYLAHLAQYAKRSSLRVLVDCANGAYSPLAARLLPLLSENGEAIFCEPNGENINRGCGSTAMAALARAVCEGGYDLGIAFDGDGDRCLLVDERGRIVDGDEILAIVAIDRHRRSVEGSFSVVGTVMTNGGLPRLLAAEGIGFSASAVGDRHVREEMRRLGCSLGGESSGHVIFSEKAVTGDGALTAMEVLSVMGREKRPLSQLAARMKRYPARTVNLPLPHSARAALSDDGAIRQAQCEADAMLAGEGRVLLRPSGTEPCLRITVEACDALLLDTVCNMLVEKVARSLRKYE